MKLYSVMVFHKGATDVKSFKSAFDLSSFSFFQRGSVQVTKLPSSYEIYMPLLLQFPSNFFGLLSGFL